MFWRQRRSLERTRLRCLFHSPKSLQCASKVSMRSTVAMHSKKGSNVFQGFFAFQEGYNAFQEGFNAFQEGYNAFQEGFNAFQEGFNAFQEGFNALEESFNAFQEGLNALQCFNSSQGFNALQEGVNALGNVRSFSTAQSPKKAKTCAILRGNAPCLAEIDSWGGMTADRQEQLGPLEVGQTIPSRPLSIVCQGGHKTMLYATHSSRQDR